ncbi:MAG: hypothetical protein WCJ30_10505 [Deltaproteobacteria bacterium]
MRTAWGICSREAGAAGGSTTRRVLDARMISAAGRSMCTPEPVVYSDALGPVSTGAGAVAVVGEGPAGSESLGAVTTGVWSGASHLGAVGAGDGLVGAVAGTVAATGDVVAGSAG